MGFYWFIFIGFILGFYGFILGYGCIHQNLSLIMVEDQVFLGFKHQTWRYNMILLEKNGCLMLIVD